MMFPPINQIPFTTLHELNMDWLLNELVTRFNAVVQQFNQIVEQFNNLSSKVDNLEADYSKFKQDTEQLLEQIQELANKLTPETIDQLLALVDDFNAVTQQLNKLQQNLENEQDARMDADEAEKTAREAADTTLQTNIDAEKAAREAADTTLQANIDAEKAAREAADKTLQDQIDTLTAGDSDNAGAIGQLRKDLTAETAARETADTAINSEITDIKTTLQNEIEARQNGDSSLQSEIGTLTTAVQDETTAREANDTLLSNRITALEENPSEDLSRWVAGKASKVIRGSDFFVTTSVNPYSLTNTQVLLYNLYTYKNNNSLPTAPIPFKKVETIDAYLIILWPSVSVFQTMVSSLVESSTPLYGARTPLQEQYQNRLYNNFNFNPDTPLIGLSDLTTLTSQSLYSSLINPMIQSIFPIPKNEGTNTYYFVDFGLTNDFVTQLKKFNNNVNKYHALRIKFPGTYWTNITE